MDFIGLLDTQINTLTFSGSAVVTMPSQVSDPSQPVDGSPGCCPTCIACFAPLTSRVYFCTLRLFSLKTVYLSPISAEIANSLERHFFCFSFSHRDVSNDHKETNAKPTEHVQGSIYMKYKTCIICCSATPLFFVYVINL